jgi:hypothetical protein
MTGFDTKRHLRGFRLKPESALAAVAALSAMTLAALLLFRATPHADAAAAGPKVAASTAAASRIAAWSGCRPATATKATLYYTEEQPVVRAHVHGF